MEEEKRGGGEDEKRRGEERRRGGGGYNKPSDQDADPVATVVDMAQELRVSLRRVVREQRAPKGIVRGREERGEREGEGRGKREGVGWGGKGKGGKERSREGGSIVCVRGGEGEAEDESAADVKGTRVKRCSVGSAITTRTTTRGGGEE